MHKNTGIKIILVILIIICMAQAGEISTLNQDVEDLSSRITHLKRDVEEQESLIEKLNKQEESMMNVSYEILRMDFEKGVMEVEFLVNPINVFDNTKVFVNNEKTNIELTKNQDNYIGTVEYPIDSNIYQTTVCIYDGNFERESEVVDISGAITWKEELSTCEFDGYSWYGNGLLTMAGNLDYSLNINEKVVSTKFVFCDKIRELEPALSGRIDLNESEYVGMSESEEVLFIEKVYVEIITEAGDVYKIYPYICESSDYNIMNGVDMEYENSINLKENIGTYIEQIDMIKISAQGGKEYKVGILEGYDE